MIRLLEQMAGPTTPEPKSKIKPQAAPALRNATLWRHRDEILGRVTASGQADALCGAGEVESLMKMHAFAECYYSTYTTMGLHEVPEDSPEQKAHLDRAVREACLCEELQARICWHLRRLCIYHGITILEQKEGA